MFDFLFGKKTTSPVDAENIVEPVENYNSHMNASPAIERNEFVDDDYEAPLKQNNSASQTGKPIDRIYNFVAKNYEQEGYDDAIVNRGKEYRDQKIKMIRNEFQNLFQSVRLEYKDRIRLLENEIVNAEELFIISSVRKFKSLKSTLEDHLALLAEMEQLLNDNDPKMTLMIQTYERGFAKGVMVSSEQFVNL